MTLRSGAVARFHILSRNSRGRARRRQWSWLCSVARADLVELRVAGIVIVVLWTARGRVGVETGDG